ncbi:MAG: TolC family protein [Tannerella sp.]|jgi:outer membrane protein TolC|nr:TolC family protein [Tannerella sp.]
MITQFKQTGWILIWLLAFIPLITKGQSKDTLRINLETALQVALSDNPMIQIADQEIQRVDYTKKSALYAILPSLNASGQFAKVLVSQTMSLASMVIKLPTDWNVNTSLQLSLPLFVPALWYSIQMTALDMQLAVEKAHASKITLRNDVTKAYYGVLLAQDSYQTLQSGLALAEEAYLQAKNRFDVGLGSEYDVVSAEVQMKNLLPTMIEVENGIEQAKMFLKMLMGVDISHPLAVIGNLIDYNIVMDNTNVRNLSLMANTDLRQLDIQQQQLQKALLIQRTQRMPTLVGFANYGYAGVRNNAGPSFINPTETSPASIRWYSQGMLAGVQLSIPLTGIYTNTAREKQTKVQINQLATQRDYLEESLNLQVRTALNNMNNAVKQAESAKNNEALAQKGYDIAMKRYETGMGIIIEVQNASLALTQAQLSRRQAIASYLNAKADYEKVIGIN